MTQGPTPQPHGDFHPAHAGPRKRSRLHGPKLWAASGIAGLALGALASLLLPAAIHDGHPVTPVWLVAPFVLLLASIALMPFVSAHFWHRHYPDFAFVLGGFVAGYYLAAYRQPAPGGHLPYGAEHMLHAALEYYSFIALVGGLFVVSGGILVDIRGRGRPLVNTAILGGGAVLANIIGTTGASMLLIRPFMRVNRGRLRPIHIVLFIFIVSNCGGSLTPVGDPPLYLGFLKGVPFFWTLEHLWEDWLLVIGSLLAVFYAIDRFYCGRRPTIAPVVTEDEAQNLIEAEIRLPLGLHLSGLRSMVALVLMIAAVFIDPVLKVYAGIEGYPVGATFQIVVAVVAYFAANRTILKQNDFNFGPVREVGLLFFGIFLTMAPALSYLAAHGRELGIDSPTAFYFGTGALSAFLDNAPTYVNFLQLAFGSTPIDRPGILNFVAEPRGVLILDAISTGAVFFGAMTYIGNGPNFMVKAIAESEAVPMPSFFGYIGRAVAILLPVLVLHWFVFIR
jgi:Na+/H+ antiporter NhaD/arsenite permease-like protein